MYTTQWPLRLRAREPIKVNNTKSKMYKSLIKSDKSKNLNKGLFDFLIRRFQGPQKGNFRPLADRGKY